MRSFEEFATGAQPMEEVYEDPMLDSRFLLLPSGPAKGVLDGVEAHPAGWEQARVSPVAGEGAKAFAHDERVTTWPRPGRGANGESSN